MRERNENHEKAFIHAVDSGDGAVTAAVRDAAGGGINNTGRHRVRTGCCPRKCN
ncbi:hypothetical protein SDC9_81493 [bioreactor metagenome]|uniref:Uncharacterized protein n=1 Tax=bioreactor metagenome TaxID=1076179 RepID=A0A644Z864_9ZZZZ